MVSGDSDSRMIRPGDASYPSGLLDLEKPPSLHVKGRLCDQPMIAVVGTRTCTRYGIEIARSFGSVIAEAGWVTVSGLARGIDAAAHRGTLDAHGVGVAVLGSGVDRIYPRENIRLADGLLTFGGAIVSEYPGTTPPDRWRFPARNRLIAAMAQAVVVVESKVTGGAQITATLAAEIGRPVFAVPGDVDRIASAGTNQLIRDGAIPVFGASDLIEEVSLLVGVQRTVTPHGELGAIPAGGADLDALCALWDCPAKEALTRLGRLQAAGEVEWVGDRVRPV